MKQIKMLCFVPLMVLYILSIGRGEECGNNASKTSKSRCKRDTSIFCRRNSGNPYGKIDRKEPKQPTVFHDMTSTEMKGLNRYLFSNKALNLTHRSQATYKSNYLHLADLYLPPKSKVLNHLDRGQRQPTREAHVVLIMGGVQDPHIRELVVGPLPNPTYHKRVPYRPRKIPFIKRPVSWVEFGDVTSDLKNIVHKALASMLYEVYGGYLVDCFSKCLQLDLWSSEVLSLSGEQRRLFWFGLHHKVDYWILRPLDFSILIDKTYENYSILKLWFEGRMFDSFLHLKNYYSKHSNSIRRISFPLRTTNDSLSFNLRNDPLFAVPLQDPSQISPDGKRYNIHGNRVTYMFWEFDLGMSIIYGPRLFDIKFKHERIAYEISLQELLAFYSGSSPFEFNSKFFDSRILLGRLSKYLVPDVDCPGDSTFLGSYFHPGSSKTPVYNAHTFCIFELNTGMPLRRHHGYSSRFHRFYEGKVSVVLNVRTILTAGNYDYIIDFIFYHTGAIEVKVSASGVIIGSFFDGSNQYGFELQNNLKGLLHQHLYHFKVDLDIKGTKNRFETLDINNDVITTSYKKGDNIKLHQVKLIKKLKSNEKEAALKFNFSEPKQLIITSNLHKDRYGNNPGYRILNAGMSNNIRPPTTNNEQSLSWSQYQVSVTREKASEPTSSSIYAEFGPKDPVIRFQDFIDDNENIVDKDLVTWVTMGMYHIPIKEDLPVTHTPGNSKSFFLLPYNYFEENPSMGSRNAVRIDPIDVNGKTESVKVNRNGVKPSPHCDKQNTYWEDAVKKDPCLVVQCI